MTRGELKDIIKECLNEMNIMNYTESEQEIFESYALINDEIALFESNVRYILSSNECVLLQESAGETIKNIIGRIVQAIKNIVKKIGEFIKLAGQKIKSIASKIFDRGNRATQRAKRAQTKLKNGTKSIPKIDDNSSKDSDNKPESNVVVKSANEVKEEFEKKVEEKKPAIEENNKKVIGAIENYQEYLKQLNIIRDNVFDVSKLDPTQLYNISLHTSYSFTDLYKSFDVEIQKIEKAINSEKDSLDEIGENLKIDLSSLYSYSRKQSFTKMTPESLIDPVHIVDQQKVFKEFIDEMNGSIESLSKFKDRFEKLSKEVDTSLNIKNSMKKEFEDDGNTRLANMYAGKINKFNTLSSYCSAAIKSINDVMNFLQETITVYMKAYNLSLANTEIILSCIEMI